MLASTFGHGRVLAAQLLGITDVPTMVARGWTHAQIQAYRLADNQLALNAGWDRELLGLKLGELKLGGNRCSAPCRRGLPSRQRASHWSAMKTWCCWSLGFSY
jgi:hypothetical protein